MKNSFYTISNLLSLIRLFLAIPFWFLLDGIKEGDSPLFLMLIVLLAIISDFLDGYFARKFNQISEMGKILDPLADKICVASITFKLYLIGFISPLFFYMIIGRDILIFLGGIYVSAKVKKVIPSNMLGKVTVTFIALVLVLITLKVSQENLYFQTVYLITMGMIVISLVAYGIRAIEILKGKHEII